MLFPFVRQDPYPSTAWVLGVDTGYNYSWSHSCLTHITLEPEATKFPPYYYRDMTGFIVNSAATKAFSLIN